MPHLENTIPFPFFSEDNAIDLPADASWGDLAVLIVSAHGGVAFKKQIEHSLQGHPKTLGKKFWTCAVSQAVQRDPRLIRVQKGVWALRERFQKEQQNQLDERRLIECPLKPRKKD